MWPPIPSFGSNPEGLEFLPNQELPLDWDQRHTLNLLLLLAEPGVWSSSFTFSYGSGFPWTPFDRFAKRQDPLLENSERLPATYSLDIQLERNINFYGKRLSLQLQALQPAEPGRGRQLRAAAGISPGMINGAAYGGMSLSDGDRQIRSGPAAGRRRRRRGRIHPHLRSADLRAAPAVPDRDRLLLLDRGRPAGPRRRRRVGKDGNDRNHQ